MYGNRLNAEAELRIQLSSAKPDIKEIIYKNTKERHSSVFVLENSYFYYNMLFMVGCNGFVTIFK